MNLVTMTNEEVVQPEPIGGRGLPETEHLHLEKRSLAADEVLEGFEDGQVESFGVDLDEAKPRDEVGVLPCEEGLHVPSLDPDLERTGVQPPRDLDPTLAGEVVRLDHEAECLRLRFETEKVDELLGFQPTCPRPGRTQ